MTDYDVFNGDADGICALTQLRLAVPRDAVLITGIKRDITLLDRVPAVAGDRVTVLDVSMAQNRAALDRVLSAGAEVLYIDHHVAGEIPRSARLTAIIDETPTVCTSLLVNGYLHGRFTAWAVVGAFGDNLRDSAIAAARDLTISDPDRDLLEQLGIYINYNGYGERIEDLHFPPDALFRLLSRHDNPLEFIHGDHGHFARLAGAYHDDMAAAAAIQPVHADRRTAVVIFPDRAWARRVNGVYSNQLTNQHPDRAHAVLTEKPDGSYVVSVRAPLSRRTGAAELCRQFPTGGGRAAAAGINHLPAAGLTTFLERFHAAYAL